MSRPGSNAVGRFLQKPLFGTTVIPPDATVDPALFPEDEYPVHCTKCGYDLRGLPDGKCPECGTTFERGHLLVSTYVNAPAGARWRNSAARKWFWLFVVLGMAVPQIPGLAVTCLSYFGYFDAANARSLAVLPFLSRARLIVWTVILASLLCLISALVIGIKARPHGWCKRRRAIIDAMRQANSEQESA